MLPENFNHYYLFGPLIGFSAFFLGVYTIPNIFTRPDVNGVPRFQLEGFIGYLKLPFSWKQRHIAWGILPNISLFDRMKLLNLNWLFMTMLGTSLPVVYHYLIKNRM